MFKFANEISQTWFGRIMSALSKSGGNWIRYRPTKSLTMYAKEVMGSFLLAVYDHALVTGVIVLVKSETETQLIKEFACTEIELIIEAEKYYKNNLDLTNT